MPFDVRWPQAAARMVEPLRAQCRNPAFQIAAGRFQQGAMTVILTAFELLQNVP
jgi:hypothetical protein